MRTIETGLAAAAASLLSACVTVQPTLQATARPTGDSAYVGGFFARTRGNGFGLVVLNDRSGQEYVVPFDHERRSSEDTGAHAVVIEVPPGSYHVAAWVTYATSWPDSAVNTKSISGRKDVPPDHVLAKTFAVAASEVVLIGSVEGSTAFAYPRTDWTMRPRPITEASAVAAFREAFPGFAGAGVRCLVCVAEGAVPRREPSREPKREPEETGLGIPKLQL